jgi:hypothetical protein
MKRLMVLVTVVLLMAAMMLASAGVTSAQEEGADPEDIHLCFEINFPGGTGGCVATRTPATNLSAAIANLCDEPLLQNLTGTENHGQCQKVAMELFNVHHSD